MVCNVKLLHYRTAFKIIILTIKLELRVSESRTSENFRVTIIATLLKQC